uniref:Uncharacterized protein n=1 Tax=Mycena chlorophos TaxID=658473 RepID=A0ABQ0LHB0_MYCCL|nr:predicted protein [Mycena chlorophos]
MTPLGVPLSCPAPNILGATDVEAVATGPLQMAVYGGRNHNRQVFGMVPRGAAESNHSIYEYRVDQPVRGRANPSLEPQERIGLKGFRRPLGVSFLGETKEDARLWTANLQVPGFSRQYWHRWGDFVTMADVPCLQSSVFLRLMEYLASQYLPQANHWHDDLGAATGSRFLGISRERRPFQHHLDAERPRFR